MSDKPDRKRLKAAKKAVLEAYPGAYLTFGIWSIGDTKPLSERRSSEYEAWIQAAREVEWRRNGRAENFENEGD